MSRVGEQSDAAYNFDTIVRDRLLEIADAMVDPISRYFLLSGIVEMPDPQENQTTTIGFGPYPDQLTPIRLRRHYAGRQLLGFVPSQVDNVAIRQTDTVSDLSAEQIRNHLVGNHTGIKPGAVLGNGNYKLVTERIVSTPYSRSVRLFNPLVQRIMRTQVIEVMSGGYYGDSERKVELLVATEDRKIRIPTMLGQVGINGEDIQKKIKADRERIHRIFANLGWPIGEEHLSEASV